MNHTMEAGRFTIQIADMQVTGSGHSVCRDVVFLKFKGKLLFAGIADGKAEACHGPEGGKAALEALVDYIASVGVEELAHTRFPDALPCKMVSVFRSTLEELAQSCPAPFGEFASTLLLLAVDVETGRYLSLHLGDGCMLGVSQQGDIALISPPENGLTVYHTWLTTSDQAVSHFRIAHGYVHGKRRMLLMSDGATCFCWNRTVPGRARELLASAPPQELHQRLVQSQPSDDASCILLELFPREVFAEFPG